MTTSDEEPRGSFQDTSATDPQERHVPGSDVRDPMMPYRSSPLFTTETLPPALQREHRTKRGVWGVIRILEGSLRYCKEDGSSEILSSDRPGLIRPDEPHHVELVGHVSMRVDFYDHEPPT